IHPGFAADFLPVLNDHNPRNANDSTIGGDIFQHHGLRTNFDIVTNLDIAQHLRACADHDVAPQSGVPFAGFFTGSAQGDSLKQDTTFSHFSSFTNDHPHTVIDKNSSGQFGGGMNFNPRKKSVDLRN